MRLHPRTFPARTCRPLMRLCCLLVLAWSLPAVPAAASPGAGEGRPVPTFESDWPAGVTQTWVGPAYWANRLQDWRLADGRLECVGGRADLPMRTVHLLTHRLAPARGAFEMTVETGLLHDGGNAETDQTWSGFLVGAGGSTLDYRAAALVHHAAGAGGGLIAAVDGTGRAFFLDNSTAAGARQGGGRRGGPALREAVTLHLTATPTARGYTLRLTARDADGTEISRAAWTGVDPEQVTGNVALVSHAGGAGTQDTRYWYRDWRLAGEKVAADERRTAGPILFTQYTLHNGTLKLAAQMMPFALDGALPTRLEVQRAGAWERVDEAAIDPQAHMALFRVEGWDATREAPYRVVYDDPVTGQTYTWTGRVRHDPVEQREITLAAFTGNQNVHGRIDGEGTFPFLSQTWFPHAEVVAHVRTHDPDLLFFSGDQIYESNPTGADRSGGEGSRLDYLYKWYLWGWAFRDLTRDIPTVTIPDDHDVYHGNIWGDWGKPGTSQNTGGYLMPPAFVRLVEQTQTSHLPDPYDPTPVAQGIGVYYTDLNWGGVSFAVLEDRKFKSPPFSLLPFFDLEINAGGHIMDMDFDTRQADIPGLDLIGERQMVFLEDWAADWRGGVQFKTVLSQTIFANLQTREDYAPEMLDRDLDANGWPQAERNRALHEMRRAFALHVAGDQHLASTIQYGIDEWNDAGWALCVPSVANYWLRSWLPPAPGGHHQPGMPPYTGEYEDGFHNKITVHAVTNPEEDPAGTKFPAPVLLHQRKPGYGIVRFDKATRDITLEAWPRYADPADPAAKPYPGWPIRIHQLDNYGRQPAAYLPTLHFEALQDPMIQVVDEADGEVVYTLRINGTRFRPMVFRPGSYTVRVGDDAQWLETLTGVAALPAGQEQVLTIRTAAR